MLSVGLAMDAFAVSVANGISVKNFDKRCALRQSLFFGVFQSAFIMLGCKTGVVAGRFMGGAGRLTAFALLVLLGINMIKDSLSDEGEDEPSVFVLTASILIFQAVATAIDAFAAGIGIALVSVNIVCAAALIGAVTFVITFFGGFCGRTAGKILQTKADVFGGIVLIIIGVKTLLEGTLF